MSSRSAAFRGLVVALAVAPLLGCSGVPEDRQNEAIGAAEEPVTGGYSDTTDANVVGIYNATESAVCSGSLIAPNVVLTARHCVAPILDQANGGVDCGTTQFGANEAAADFFVTTKATMDENPLDYHGVQKVVTPPASAYLCGNDQAILILGQTIAATEATPLVPRVDIALAKGETYSAIGYGGTDNNGDGAGVRRRRDKLIVDCVGVKCDISDVKSTEFLGDTGICEGDSGGPAMDAEGRVVGVTSRGGANCTTPIYGYVYGWAQWIKDTTTEAAELGGYAAPAWTTGGTTEPQYSDPVGGTCKVPSDCASGRCVGDASGYYCSRLCDKAACPSGFVCDTTDFPTTPVCIKAPMPTADTSSGGNRTGASDDSTSSTANATSSCNVGRVGADPSKPIPWLTCAAALVAFAASRKRRR